MAKAFFLLFYVLALPVFGQAAKNNIFSKTDYPASRYSVKEETFDFSGFKIELIQAGLRDNQTHDNTAVSCRIWLTVKKGNAIVNQLFLNGCEGVGGCSGIYVSKEQTRKDYFILSKYGDYDGRILIIDTSGTIQSFVGGHYYLSADSKYLFSPYDSDAYGLTVYDFSKNQVLFTSDNLPDNLADFYYLDNNYFAIVNNDDKKGNQTDIVTFDFTTKKLIPSTVADSYIAKATLLKTYNVFTYAPCNCGQTKKSK